MFVWELVLYCTLLNGTILIRFYVPRQVKCVHPEVRFQHSTRHLFFLSDSSWWWWMGVVNILVYLKLFDQPLLSSNKVYLIMKHQVKFKLFLLDSSRFWSPSRSTTWCGGASPSGTTTSSTSPLTTSWASPWFLAAWWRGQPPRVEGPWPSQWWPWHSRSSRPLPETFRWWHSHVVSSIFTPIFYLVPFSYVSKVPGFIEHP